MSNLSETAKGVEAAFDFWLSQHDVTVPEMFAEAVQKAVRGWLEEHSDEIVKALERTREHE